MRISKPIYDYDSSDIIKELNLAKHQIKDCAGNAWIYPAMSKAIIMIMCLEDRIHALENEINILKTADDTCRNIIDRLEDGEYDMMQQDGKFYDVVTIENLKKIMKEEGINL